MSDRHAVDRVVLALTTNIEPDEQLIRDVHAEAGTDLEVDIWPGSRLAGFLDDTPEGQWLRSKQFSVAQTRVSAALPREISAKSLAHDLPQTARESIVERSPDTGLRSFANGLQGVGFVIGGSGQAKAWRAGAWPSSG